MFSAFHAVRSNARYKPLLHSPSQYRTPLCLIIIDLRREKAALDLLEDFLSFLGGEEVLGEVNHVALPPPPQTRSYYRMYQHESPIISCPVSSGTCHRLHVSPALRRACGAQLPTGGVLNESEAARLRLANWNSRFFGDLGRRGYGGVFRVKLYQCLLDQSLA